MYNTIDIQVVINITKTVPRMSSHVKSQYITPDSNNNISVQI
jgi:hypothetical protein